LKFVPRRDKRRLATIDAETESANMRVRTAT
jgi:hypothetical protein